jgi:hypothetical protein
MEEDLFIFVNGQQPHFFENGQGWAICGVLWWNTNTRLLVLV